MERPRRFVEPTFGRRLGGAFVDSLVVALPVGVLLAVTIGGRTASALGVLVFLIYTIVLTSRSGQTLGKMAVGTRVVDFTRAGGVPPPHRVALRTVVLSSASFVGLALPSFDFVGTLVLLAVIIPVLGSPLHRGLHDRAAGTIVTMVAERR